MAQASAPWCFAAVRDQADDLQGTYYSRLSPSSVPVFVFGWQSTAGVATGALPAERRNPRNQTLATPLFSGRGFRHTSVVGHGRARIEAPKHR